MFLLISSFMIFTSPILAGSIELIGGGPAPDGEYPASVYLEIDGGRCSGTVVGERVVLTAAHCAIGNRRIRFEAAGKTYTGRCDQAAGYKKNTTADWALCELDKAVEGVPFERIELDRDSVAEGDLVLLTGYGCTVPGRGTGGNDGIYRIGEAKVLDVPAGKSNDIVLANGAALCFGDSGGPGFVVRDGGKRTVVGVNSRGDIKVMSFLSATFTSQARSFMQTWAAKKDLQVCGVYGTELGCRE